MCCEGTGVCDWPIRRPEGPHRAGVCHCDQLKQQLSALTVGR